MVVNIRTRGLWCNFQKFLIANSTMVLALYKAILDCSKTVFRHDSTNPQDLTEHKVMHYGCRHTHKGSLMQFSSLKPAVWCTSMAVFSQSAKCYAICSQLRVWAPLLPWMAESRSVNVRSSVRWCQCIITGFAWFCPKNEKFHLRVSWLIPLKYLFIMETSILN